MRPALVIALVLSSLSLFAQDGTVEQRTISVSGEAVVMVVPNQAVVTIGVETFDPKLDVATANNERIASGLVADWKSLGIADTRISTAGASTEISYNHESGRRRTVEGYVVRRTYEVTTDGAATAEKVIARGLANGANQLEGIDFRTTEMRKYRDQARVSAVKAAREKADLIASQLGVRVGPPRNITETTSYSSWYRQSSAMTQNVMTEASGGGDPDSYGSVAPGQIAVRASVAVVFDLITR